MARPRRKINPLKPVSPPKNTEQRIYQTGGYIRLSVEDSGKPGLDTMDAQRSFIQGYIEGQPDMRLFRLYCDNGCTGTNFDRPEFEQMMEDVRTGKINCIVVKDLSRFGRNYLETGNYLEQIFPFLNVRFVAVNDHFDTLAAERASDGYIIPLKNIINAVYSRDISRKVCSALNTKRQNGDFIGSWAPYGYRKCVDNPHRIEPDEETAPVVRAIFRQRAEGESCQHIARKLSGQKIPSPGMYLYEKGLVHSACYKKPLWTHQAVRRILENEVYLGHTVQGRKRVSTFEGKKERLLPKTEWMIIPDTHEPLVDEKLFRAVQRITEETRRVYHEQFGKYDVLGTTPNLFRGLIFCADCNRSLKRYKSVTGQGKNRYYVYVCPAHAANPKACPKKYLHEDMLKEVIGDILQREMALAGNLENLVRQYSQAVNAAHQVGAENRETDSVNQSLRRAEMLYDGLYQNYAERLISEQEYRKMKRQYQSEIERLKTRLAELTRREDEYKRKTAQTPRQAAYGRFRLETELTEEMVHTLIERIEVDADDHISVTLRYQDECRTLAGLLEAKGDMTPT